MIRNIISVFIGLLIGNIAIALLHYMGLFFFPLPEGIDMSDIESIKQYILVAPNGALLMVMFAHLGGTFLGAIAAGFFSNNKLVAYIIGAFFTVAGGYNLFILPHPWWFWIEMFFYFPAAILGSQILSKKN